MRDSTELAARSIDMSYEDNWKTFEKLVANLQERADELKLQIVVRDGFAKDLAESRVTAEPAEIKKLEDQLVQSDKLVDERRGNLVAAHEKIGALELSVGPEQAAWLTEGLRPDGSRLENAEKGRFAEFFARISSDATDLAQYALERAGAKFEAVKEGLSETKEQGAQKLEELHWALQDKALGASIHIAHGIERAEERVKVEFEAAIEHGMVEGIGEAMIAAAEHFGHDLPRDGDAVQSGKEYAKIAIETAKIMGPEGVLLSAQHELRQASDAVMDGVGQATQAVKDSVGRATEAIQDGIGHAVEAVKEGAGKAVDFAAQALVDAKFLPDPAVKAQFEVLGAKYEKQWDNLDKQIHELQHKFDERHAKNPNRDDLQKELTTQFTALRDHLEKKQEREALSLVHEKTR